MDLNQPTPPASPATPTPTPDQAPPAIDNKKVEKRFLADIQASKRVRRDHYAEWKTNVELRIGHIANRFTDGVNIGYDYQTEINPDWSLTKTKTANLFSQVPTVQLTHENKQYAPAIAPFSKQLNYEIGEKRGNIGVAMEECLNDCVNAAGVGAMIVGYAARFQKVQVPAIDTAHLPPQVVQQMQASGQIPMRSVDKAVSDKFFASRISPTDLLWPSRFTGSNFDDGDWIGYTGRKTWAEGKVVFKLTDDVKERVVGADDTDTEENLRTNDDRSRQMASEGIKFDEIFYWRYRVDPEEKCFSCIWRIVYVYGLTDPVIHEPWTGQLLDPQSQQYVGACKFPVRVLTLTYITDNPIPPSDSQAGRPQVNDMRRSRSQMFKNRERSIPIRWFDTNRVDPLIQEMLMKGDWQGMIPMQGSGERAIGEVARASYPSEDLSFDQMSKMDLEQSWQLGPNQEGLPQTGRKTSAEVQITNANFSTRIGQEKNRVASFFLGAVEVMAGLIALYSDFKYLSDQDRAQMQQVWNSRQVLTDLVFKIRPDSTVVQDSNSRIQKLSQALNMTVKSGYVNPAPIISEIFELSGIDPSEVMIQPAPPPPQEPNISIRFTGKDDLQNPVVMGMLVESKQAPSPESMATAKKLLLDAQQAPVPTPPPIAGGPPGAPPGGPPPSPGGPSAPLHPAQAEAHQDWQLASKVAARSRDLGNG